MLLRSGQPQPENLRGFAELNEHLRLLFRRHLVACKTLQNVQEFEAPKLHRRRARATRVSHPPQTCVAQQLFLTPAGNINRDLVIQQSQAGADKELIDKKRIGVSTCRQLHLSRGKTEEFAVGQKQESKGMRGASWFDSTLGYQKTRTLQASLSQHLLIRKALACHEGQNVRDLPTRAE